MAFNSLRSQLLFWLLGPLALIAALDAWATYRSARETATIVQERMLLGAARVIGEQVHLEEDVVQVMIPPAALELFASPSRDRVFYRVSGSEGRLLSGYYDLALPPRPPAPEEAVFFDAVQRERPVRAVGFAQPLLAAPQRGPILIEVAQTLEGRDELAREIWGTAVSRHFALLVLVGLLLWFGLRRGIRPLLELRDWMGRRSPGSLDRLQVQPVPAELQPFVAAVNDYVERLDRHMSAHSRFIADASHQLRTPLTLLNTQVAYALRQPEAGAREEALRAIHHSVQHSMRLVQQLLAFTRAEAGAARPPSASQVDLAAIVRKALESLASLAQQRSIDLGFERAGGAALVPGSPQMLYELVANLLDNALRYTPPGGVVTARVSATAQQVELRLEDNGPGIPPEQREKVFERFYRLHDDRSDGCGLGLAIVREIARGSGAHVALGQPAAGPGLSVTVSFPALR
ncbi:MAG: periplasmic sensor signal transduction histidine kinase [Ramlibacter sp.]|nr:periplasmic sensor signal transduction histidine kinase [Ramlibacter sp.]